MARGSQTITVKGVTQRDWQGDPTGDSTPDVDITGCVVFPQSTRESGDQGIVVLTSKGVFVPPNPEKVPTAEDQIVFEGQTYAVVGAVGHYVGKSGKDKGYLFTMRRMGSQTR